jgi:hypothetical protein
MLALPDKPWISHALIRMDWAINVRSLVWLKNLVSVVCLGNSRARRRAK